MPIKSIETPEEDIMVVTFMPDTPNGHLASLEQKIRPHICALKINEDKLTIEIVRADITRTLAVLAQAERGIEGEKLQTRFYEVAGGLDEKLQNLFLDTRLVQPPDGIGRPYIEEDITNLPITKKSDNNLIGLLTVDEIAGLAGSKDEQVISEGVIMPAICAKLGKIIMSAINQYDDLLAEVDTGNGGIHVKISEKMSA